MPYSIPRRNRRRIRDPSVRYGGNNTLIKVQVENSGSLIDTRILEHLKDQTVKPKGNGIGLLNIDSRLRILFGDDYHLNFDNRNNMAIVSFSIPRKAEASSSDLS